VPPSAWGSATSQAAVIGGVDTTTARNVTTNGTVNGIVNQFNVEAGALFNEQLLVVGGTRGVEANNINATGSIALRGACQFATTAIGGVNSQVANVGGVQNTRANNITTNGLVVGVLNQVVRQAFGGGNVQHIVVGGVQGATTTQATAAKAQSNHGRRSARDRRPSSPSSGDPP
jgi:hypothetical protein